MCKKKITKKKTILIALQLDKHHEACATTESSYSWLFKM